MAVRVIRTEDPAEEPKLRLIAPPEAVEPVEAPAVPVVAPEPVQAPEPPVAAQPPPLETDLLQQRLTLQTQIVAVLLALANVVAVRFILVLALCAAAFLTAFGEHTVLSTVNAALFDILVLVPLIALAVRKG